MTTIKTGQQGEKLAANYLQKKGYKIISRNFRTRFGEIDLIVKKSGLLVFVEVKSSKGKGIPEWQINQRKIQRVKKMAQVYLVTKQPDYQDLRIDAICIVLKPAGQPLIRHHEAIGSY